MCLCGLINSVCIVMPRGPLVLICSNISLFVFERDAKGVFIATQLNSTQLTQFVGREVINKNTTDYLYAVQLGQLS